MGNWRTAKFNEEDSRKIQSPKPDEKPLTSLSIYSVYGDNPIWHNDPVGDTWLDGIMGSVVGNVKYIIPFSSSFRDWYPPTDPDDYNSALRNTDAGYLFLGLGGTIGGGGMIAGGTAAVVGGAGVSLSVVGAPVGAASMTGGAVAIVSGEAMIMTGTYLRANTALNVKDGYDRDRKDPPNPTGKKGGTEHQNKINEVEKQLKKDGYTDIEREEKVLTPNGEKGSRFIDLKGTNPNGKDELFQIGKQTKGGIPVKRERTAMNDIEESIGIKPAFIPYNK